MKKILAFTIALTLMMITLVACTSSRSTEEKMLDKLHQIKSDWTEQQVRDLLGEPDRFGERSVIYELFYTISPTSEATIAFWNAGIKITVTNLETGEKTVILDVDIGE
mgnify:CR=1 FL=1